MFCILKVLEPCNYYFHKKIADNAVSVLDYPITPDETYIKIVTMSIITNLSLSVFSTFKEIIFCILGHDISKRFVTKFKHIVRGPSFR